MHLIFAVFSAQSCKVLHEKSKFELTMSLFLHSIFNFFSLLHTYSIILNRFLPEVLQIGMEKQTGHNFSIQEKHFSQLSLRHITS